MKVPVKVLIKNKYIEDLHHLNDGNKKTFWPDLETSVTVLGADGEIIVVPIADTHVSPQAEPLKGTEKVLEGEVVKKPNFWERLQAKPLEDGFNDMTTLGKNVTGAVGFLACACAVKSGHTVDWRDNTRITDYISRNY